MIELIVQFLDSPGALAPALTGFIAGILGTIVANFTTNYLWHSHQIASLELGQVTEHPEYNSDGFPERVHYRIPVSNDGNSSATNCRASIHLKGSVNSNDELDGYEFEIETSLIWESNRTTDRKINRGDEANLELLRWIRDNGDGFEFPSESGWENNAPIQLVSGQPRSRIHIDAFRNTEWTLTDIRVTGEVAKPIEGQISIGWDGEEPEIRLERDSTSLKRKIPLIG